MPKTLSAPIYSLLLALVFALAAPRAEAKSFPGLAGKYTGVLIISQGSSTRVLGNANVTVKPNGLIAIKGSINGVAFVQTIKLGPGSKATVSTILPGISSFNQSVTGRFAGSRNVTVSGSFDTTQKGGSLSPGTLKMKIGKITYGSTICIQSLVTLSSSSPVYVTITAS